MQLLFLVLLWVVLGFLLAKLLLEIIPKQYFTWLGGFLVFAIIVLLFFTPTNALVSPIWTILSLPFQPLGLAILLWFLGAMRIKGDKISKPGPTLIWTGFFVLLVASTPFLSNRLAQLLGPGVVQNQPTVQMAKTIGWQEETLTAFVPNGESIQLTTNASPFPRNPVLAQLVPPNQAIGIRAFIPSIGALQQTTQVINSFFSNIYFQLRGRPVTSTELESPTARDVS